MHRPNPTSRLRPIAFATALGAALALLGACNIVAPVAYLVHGPPKVQAQHELNSRLKTVIFVDDRANRLPRRSLKNVIGQRAEETLIERGSVPQQNMIAARSAIMAASTETDSELMSIAAIGRAVGADQVIYVTIEGFTVTRDGATVQPIAGALIKIISAEDDRRIWPEDRSGFPVRVELPASGAPIPQDRSGMSRLQTGLAETLGLQIARTFFEHERDALSGSLGD
ncbi:MAG: hypothetical protein H6814_04080 [Phycisphaeraceae bacterium]|nr:hypothetical protein [Phycisphaeraceae bacterium]